MPMLDHAEQLTLFSLNDHQPPLPNYQVRESARARHVSLKVSYQGTLEVVVPSGFNQQEIPQILEQRRSWIVKTLRRIETQRDALPDSHTSEQPLTLELRSRQETWHLHYEVVPGSPIALTQSQPLELTLRGHTQDTPTCHDLLRNWLHRKARAELVPWLQHLSQQCDLAYSRVSVRGQSTRWGSCSSNQAISLNYKLLFLPPAVVEYVLVHELCHTVHMNHSSAFWQLVRQYYRECDRAKADLKKAWQYIPQWIDGAG
jgi:predicted metal-dependent hydrolase